MLCYKDRTFCDSSNLCLNHKCYRHLSTEDYKTIKKENWVVCYADLFNTDDCEGFIPAYEDEEELKNSDE